MQPVTYAGGGQTQGSAAAVSAAPGAGTVLADTGQLAAGLYEIEWSIFAQDTNAVGKGIQIEHRNAANAATSAILGGCSAPDNQYGGVRRIRLAANERIRAVSGAASAASSVYGARITALLISA